MVENTIIEIPKEKAKNYQITHQEALQFCKTKGFNTDYYFLLDYSIHPGKNRFFIYDFKKKQIIDQQLVAHGICNVFEAISNQNIEAKFSNQKDSHCSSKGKYHVGARDYSGWGIHVKYWLNGLEKTNNNAKDRVVVLHSWENIPDEETYPYPIDLSWGCPAVSNNFMKVIDAKIKASENQDILLWIIE